MSKLYNSEVIENTQNESGDHFFCALCRFMLKPEDDHQSHSEHSCCQECYLTFAESRRKDWLAGWRPKKSEIRKYINGRKRLLINKTKSQELL